MTRTIIEINGDTYRIEAIDDTPGEMGRYRLRKLMNAETYVCSASACNCPAGHYRGHCKHQTAAAELDRERLLEHLDALGRVFVPSLPPYDRKVME